MLHVIGGLGTGGTEKVLSRLLAPLRQSGMDAMVVSLTTEGSEGEGMARDGIEVVALGMGPGTSSIGGLLRLVDLVRTKKPSLIQTWMYHADFAGGLATLFHRSLPVLWNLRQSNLESLHNKRSTLWLARACALLSGQWPTRIICGSEAARTSHVAFGYEAARMIVIPNGFDLEAFRPDPVARREVRAELGIPDTSLVITHIGRFHSQKDYPNLLGAADLVAAARSDVCVVLCGDGVDYSNPLLAAWATRPALAGRFKLLGNRPDVQRILAASDVAASASIGEGFPNAVGEAMATGIPCVATDVGDTADLVGDTGMIVAPAEPQALASGILGLLDRSPEERSSLGLKARARIGELFGLERMATRYVSVYREVLGEP